LPTFISYKLLEACREPGCPLCRLEQRSVERYLDNQFYESVNSPPWRDRLRASLGLCREHAWLGVNQRLGDALGYSIIYHDVVSSLLKRLNGEGGPVHPVRRRAPWPGQIPEALRAMIARAVAIFTPRKRCPVCEHRDEVTRNTISALVKEVTVQEVTDAIQASDGLCLPHLKLALEHVDNAPAYERLLEIHRTKLESLKRELAEFIRKNDYQAIKEGFGSEGEAWLRAIGMVAGSRK